MVRGLLALRNKSLDTALLNIYSIVVAGNTNVKLLSWLKDVTGVGQIYTLKRNGTKHKLSWQWRVSSWN